MTEVSGGEDVGDATLTHIDPSPLLPILVQPDESDGFEDPQDFLKHANKSSLCSKKNQYEYVYFVSYC